MVLNDIVGGKEVTLWLKCHRLSLFLLRFGRFSWMNVLHRLYALTIISRALNGCFGFFWGFFEIIFTSYVWFAGGMELLIATLDKSSSGKSFKEYV